jgi:chorismate-pyruvate lyase
MASGTDAPSIWTFSTEQLPSGQPLNGLLVHRDLLTKEMEQVFGGVISVKLLHMSETQQGDQLRRVIIKCGLESMVYAETLIPSDTISCHLWLLDLGDQPLGARMCEYGKVIRSEYQYCCLAASDRIYERAVVHAHPDADNCMDLWARRYRLSLGSSHVQITEVFLPAVVYLE